MTEHTRMERRHAAIPMFWEVRVDQNELSIRFGRLGTRRFRLYSIAA